MTLGRQSCDGNTRWGIEEWVEHFSVVYCLYATISTISSRSPFIDVLSGSGSYAISSLASYKRISIDIAGVMKFVDCLTAF
jgi:hypothetical protein